MNNTEILCFVLGWQGGTVHQVSQKLNISITEILDANPEQMRELCRKAQQVRSNT